MAGSSDGISSQELISVIELNRINAARYIVGAAFLLLMRSALKEWWKMEDRRLISVIERGLESGVEIEKGRVLMDGLR